ncbi:MAG TPA: type II toxin-antitoxin system HicA family toxin [Terriglobia bacterium]|nr:type II toxin-antitoxin system HicA family toxin [Terriglobia bacterium]
MRQKGSHLQLKRGNLLVTVPIHSADLSSPLDPPPSANVG